jgi:hypothetical protein
LCLALNLLGFGLIQLIGEIFMLKLWRAGIALILGVFCSAWVIATPITCAPTDQRIATLDSATACKTGNDDNIHSPAQVSTLFGGTWVKEGELTNNGVNDLFNIVLTTGTWGSNNVAGTWSIDSSFWTIYGIAAITMHVGHGNGNPDYFAWLITPNQLSGTFSYRDLDGKGGGLSNLFLFGSGTPELKLPEPNIALLLFVGLCAIFFARRGMSR